jgi:signal transduction histidine kinase
MKRIRENVSRASERIAELSRAGRQWQDSVDQKVDLAATLDLLRDRLAPTVQATKAVLQIDCPKGLAIRGDAHAVRSAVENVAANALEALQATGSGGKLALRARQRNGTVELIVQDDGPGIPEPVHQALFAPFASGHGSTGLGLAIARALARAGGGDLVCTDAAPGRTTFRFTFQAA